MNKPLLGFSAAHVIAALVIAALVSLSSCTIAFGGLPEGKAGVRLGLGGMPRALSEQMASLTIEGTGPGTAVLEPVEVSSGDSLVILEPGAWSFTVLAKDSEGTVLQEDTQEAVLVAGETVTLTFVVHTRGAVSGRVISDAGEPVVGATLWVANLDTTPATIATSSVVTDAEGRFSVEDLPRGTLQVFVMDLAARDTPPSAGRWWRPWVVDSTQTGRLTLEERVSEPASLYLWTEDPSATLVSGVPMTLVETATDRVREHAWSTTLSARAFFFTDPDPALGTTFLFRSHHDRYDWGTEPNTNFTTAMWIRRDAAGWVKLAAGSSSTDELNQGGAFPGAPSTVVLHLKNSGGQSLIGIGNQGFTVDGPGLSSPSTIFHDETTGDLTFTSGTTGTYTFTGTGVTETHFNPFTIEIPRVGALVDQDKFADTDYALP